jgi:hypothetical protein
MGSFAEELIKIAGLPSFLRALAKSPQKMKSLQARAASGDSVARAQLSKIQAHQGGRAGRAAMGEVRAKGGQKAVDKALQGGKAAPQASTGRAQALAHKTDIADVKVRDRRPANSQGRVGFRPNQGATLGGNMPQTRKQRLLRQPATPRAQRLEQLRQTKTPDFRAQMAEATAKQQAPRPPKVKGPKVTAPLPPPTDPRLAMLKKHRNAIGAGAAGLGAGMVMSGGSQQAA